MSKVLVILAPGFEEIEGITIIDVLRRAGAQVTVAGTITGPIEASRQTRHLADAVLDDIHPESYDMLVLPGGQPGTNNLRAHPLVRATVEYFRVSGKKMAAICAAPSVLAAFGVLEGKRYSCHPTAAGLVQESEKPSGKAIYDPAARVVVDGNVITSLSAGSAMEFALTLVEVIYGPEKAVEVNKGLLSREG